MHAPGLDVLDLETGPLHLADGVADVVERAAGKDVFGQRPLLGPQPLGQQARFLGAAEDGVVEEQAVVGEQRADLAHVGRDVVEADRLVHADRGDLVVGAAGLHVVGELERHLPAEAEPRHLGLGIGQLLLRQRHAVRLDAVVLGRMAEQRAPAAADVEEALAGLQAQLAADHVELVVLGGGEVVRPVAIIGAGVDHLGVEEERVELVRQVVVERDELLVVAVAPTFAGDLALELALRRYGRARHEQERGQILGEPELAQAVELDAAAAAVELAAEVEQRAAREIDAPGDVELDEAVDGRPPQQRGDDAGVGDLEHERPLRVGAERVPAAVPQLDVGVQIELGPDVAGQPDCTLQEALVLLLVHGAT